MWLGRRGSWGAGGAAAPPPRRRRPGHRAVEHVGHRRVDPLLATGNNIRGSPAQITPRNATRIGSSRPIGRRAAGTSDSAATPRATRAAATTPARGPPARRPRTPAGCGSGYKPPMRFLQWPRNPWPAVQTSVSAADTCRSLRTRRQPKGVHGSGSGSLPAVPTASSRGQRHWPIRDDCAPPYAIYPLGRALGQARGGLDQVVEELAIAWSRRSTPAPTARPTQSRPAPGGRISHRAPGERWAAAPGPVGARRGRAPADRGVRPRARS
jgi:hypothetical protein